MLHKENFYHILSPLSNYFQILSISLHTVLHFFLFFIKIYKYTKQAEKEKRKIYYIKSMQNHYHHAQ